MDRRSFILGSVAVAATFATPIVVEPILGFDDPGGVGWHAYHSYGIVQPDRMVMVKVARKMRDGV